MTMKKQLLTLAAITGLSTTSFTALAGDIRSAITDGDTEISLRYRLENVDVDGVDKEATASTLKTRLTFQSKPIYDAQLILEFDDVHVIGEQNYLDGANRPLIADPEGTELNQAALKYTGITDTTLILGKQRIVLGNQRFVGGVAWRQHEQTYNALTAVNQSLPDTKITYSYVDKVNSFVHTNPDTSSDSHLVYAENQSIDHHKITAYAFLLDDRDNFANSSQTLGARVDGQLGGLGYALEYAQQSDYSRPSNNDFDADYEFIEVSYQLEPVKILAAREVLGSDDGAGGFQTPLATKHKFNGWADQFLGTPQDGLQDTYIGAVAGIAGATVKLFYHDFEADEGDMDYGDEINLAVAKKFGQVNALLKFADFSADDDDNNRADTQKIWLQVATTF